jgi:NAD(P)-dependent dehydrogenase (short-subunit alcohol dehydrogenase family)
VSLVVITGANCGIGLALTRQYCERGDEVIACVRSSSTELKSTTAEIHDGIDLCDRDAIQVVCERMTSRPIDILINNAAVCLNRDLVEEQDLDAAGEEFQVNALGPLQLTMGLLPAMKPGAKIIFISSSLGSIEENEFGGSVGYRMSKAAANMFVKTLSNELWSQMICAAAIHPGFVKTRMTKFAGDWEPEDAARGTIARIDKLTMDSSGTFWHQGGRRVEW